MYLSFPFAASHDFASQLSHKIQSQQSTYFPSTPPQPKYQTQYFLLLILLLHSQQTHLSLPIQS